MWKAGKLPDSGQHDQCTGKDVCSPCFERVHRGDSQTEAENFPGVVIRDITQTMAQNKVSVKVRGSVKDIYPTSSKDINFVGTYGASPTTSIFGTLCLCQGWYNCIELFREY